MGRVCQCPLETCSGVVAAVTGRSAVGFKLLSDAVFSVCTRREYYRSHDKTLKAILATIVMIVLRRQRKPSAPQRRPTGRPIPSVPKPGAVLRGGDRSTASPPVASKLVCMAEHATAKTGPPGE